jgi:hypothetical protein
MKPSLHQPHGLSKYRLLTMLVVVLALALTLLPSHDKRRLGMPEPWSYELAAQHFSQGKWHLNDEEITAARTQVRLAGAYITQYVPVAPDWWSLRQSPGHPLEMALLTKLGLPRLTNSVLAILAVFALYPALTAWHNERMAFLGVVLLLFSPLSLLALHYYSMDTFAGGIWPLIAGALLLRYSVSEPDTPRQPIFLLLAGFAAGWATIVRQTNVLLSGVLALFFLYLVGSKRPQSANNDRSRTLLPRSSWPHLAAFGGGVLVAVAILALYNNLAFGNPLANGYLYPSPYNSHNLWGEEPLTRVPSGLDTWLAGGTAWDIVVTLFLHFRLWLRPATLAWPLWPLALVGLAAALRRRPVHPTTWFLFLWLLSIYVFYAGVFFFGVTRALGVPEDQGWAFFIPSRYLFSFIFPFVWVMSGILARWTKWWALGLVGVYAAGSALFFLAVLAH